MITCLKMTPSLVKKAFINMIMFLSCCCMCQVHATPLTAVNTTSQSYINDVDKKKHGLMKSSQARDDKNRVKQVTQHDVVLKTLLSHQKPLRMDDLMLDQQNLPSVSSDWVEASSVPETLDTFYLRSRNSLSGAETIESTLKPVCKNIVQQNASIKIHTVSEKDYRWLMVKLMLCTRKLNKDFWLRHSYVVSQSDFLKVTLHPKRNVALSLTPSKF